MTLLRCSYTRLTNETGCLQKNTYKEEKCQKEIDALYECCNAFYEKEGEKVQTVSCPKASLLR